MVEGERSRLLQAPPRRLSPANALILASWDSHLTSHHQSDEKINSCCLILLNLGQFVYRHTRKSLQETRRGFLRICGAYDQLFRCPVHKLEPMDLTQTVPYFCKAQKLRSDLYLRRVAKDEEKNNILWRTITTWNSKLSVLELSCVGTLPCAFMRVLSMAASLPRAAACDTQKWPGTFQLYVFAVIEPTPRLFQIKSQLSYVASACFFLVDLTCFMTHNRNTIKICLLFCFWAWGSKGQGETEEGARVDDFGCSDWRCHSKFRHSVVVTKS